MDDIPFLFLFSNIFDFDALQCVLFKKERCWNFLLFIRLKQTNRQHTPAWTWVFFHLFVLINLCIWYFPYENAHLWIPSTYMVYVKRSILRNYPKPEHTRDPGRKGNEFLHTRLEGRNLSRGELEGARDLRHQMYRKLSFGSTSSISEKKGPFKYYVTQKSGIFGPLPPV